MLTELIGAATASVSRIRSVGASSMSSPRLPPETIRVYNANALESRTVGEDSRWPRGEMPPRT